MKLIFPSLLFLFSSTSFASLYCENQNSQLHFSEKRGVVKLVLVSKQQRILFHGEKIQNDPSSPFEVDEYELQDASAMPAKLLISEIPTFPSKLPCNGRRICDDALPQFKITADLNYQGQDSHYVCQTL
ncbi:MAG: hypothetical protein AB7I27_19290 [Bacteriovoracaceae bacterium]